MDAVCRGANHFVLPDANHSPSRLVKPHVSVGIPTMVTKDLVWPVPAVDVMLPSTVFRTTMPEAAVDQDRHLGSGEDDIHPPAGARHDRQIDSVSEATTMQLPTKGHLRHGVTTSLQLHTVPHSGRGCPGAGG